MSKVIKQNKKFVMSKGLVMALAVLAVVGIGVFGMAGHARAVREYKAKAM